MTPYKEWRLPDGSLYHVIDMPDCCRHEAQQTTSFEAEFECRVCGAEWRRK